MLKDKIKVLVAKGEEGNNKKRIENLVVFLIILVVTIIAVNLIWSGDKSKEKTQTSDPNKKLATASQSKETTVENGQEDLTKQLENILAHMEGVGKVKVLITYSQTSQNVPMYNEETSQKDTEEKDTGGGTRKVVETEVKRDVIYEEASGQKTPITQSVVSPKIEGAIVTAEGAGNANTKTNIIQAVEAVTGIATHKIQVIEMKKAT